MVVFRSSALEQAITGEDIDEDDEERESKPYPENTTQDFAKCYSECLKDIDTITLITAGGICAACVAAVTALAVPIPGVQAPAIGVVQFACALCAVAIGVVLGNCLLTCHEMLGQ